MQCSFCETTRKLGELVRASEVLGSEQPIQICQGCARAAAEALQVEDQLEEGRTSDRPNPLRPERPLGIVCEATFEFEGRTLEWSAERMLKLTRAPVRVLEVRALESGDSRIVEISDDEEVDASHVETVAPLFGEEDAARSAIAARSIDPSTETEWASVDFDGVHYEWRTWRAIRQVLVRAVELVVRDPRTGARGAMGMPAGLTPTVDDAVIVASSELGLHAQH